MVAAPNMLLIARKFSDHTVSCGDTPETLHIIHMVLSGPKFFGEETGEGVRRGCAPLLLSAREAKA